MLPELIEFLSRSGLSREDCLLAVLYSFDGPASVGRARERAAAVGIRSIGKWNISQVLTRAAGRVVRVPTGWQLTDLGKKRLAEVGLGNRSPLVRETSLALRAVVQTITDQRRRDFIADALLCFDKGAFKPAVVYAWVGAAWVLE